MIDRFAAHKASIIRLHISKNLCLIGYHGIKEDMTVLSVSFTFEDILAFLDGEVL